MDHCPQSRIGATGDMSDDKELYEEMKALALRYGTKKCQKILNVVKFSPEIVTKTTKKTHLELPPLEISVDNGGRTSLSMEKLMELVIFGSDRRLSFGPGVISPDSQLIDPFRFVKTMERLHDYFLVDLPTTQRGSDHQPKLSPVFHNLLLPPLSYIVVPVLNSRKCMELFNGLVLEGILPWGNRGSISEDIIVCMQKAMARSDLPRSLTIKNCDIDDTTMTELGQLIEANNYFEDIRLDVEMRDSACPRPFGCLEGHVYHHENSSKLKSLCIENKAVDNLTRAETALLLAIIADVPNLENFSMKTKNIWTFDELPGYIEKSQIQRLSLDWDGADNSAITRPRMLAVLNTIASSKTLRTISIGIDDLVATGASYIDFFELALSPIHNIFDISIQENSETPLDDLVDLVPKLSPRLLPASRQLRRLGFIQSESHLSDFLCMVGDCQISLLERLRALLAILVDGLPYLHSIGMTIDDWTLHRKIFEGNTEASKLWDDILVQIEKNHVGMALLRPDILPTVPRGLWANVLANAIAYDEEPKELSWNGIHSMVRGLVLGGHTGWTLS